MKPLLGLPKPVHQGYDPRQLVRVRPATREGSHAILEQPLFKRLDNDGRVVAYTYMTATIEDSDFEASNRAAFAIAEKLNADVKARQPVKDEQDDG